MNSGSHTPYAQPASSSARSSHESARRALFVPPSVRVETRGVTSDHDEPSAFAVENTVGEVVAEGEELPWIDAYLDAQQTPTHDHAATLDAEAEAVEYHAPVTFSPPTPFTPVFSHEAMSEVLEDEETSDSAAALFSASDDVGVPSAELEDAESLVEYQAFDTDAPVADDASGPTSGFTSAPADATEHWPLDDASDEMRALAATFDAPVAKDHDSDVNVGHDEHDIDAPAGNPLAAQSLAAWEADDIMDIMPSQSTGALTGNPAHLWAEQARRAATDAAQVEAAATTIEAIARRVRSGELSLPVHNAEMGEAAALAAALAALLNSTR